MDQHFQNELAQWGPGVPFATPTFEFSQNYCKKLATSHYENFSVASLLLPRKLLPHFHAIYSYCRWADDLGDETQGGEESLSLLAWWRSELLQCFEGSPHHPIMVALEKTVRRFNIPQMPFLNLIKAFEQDQVIKSYETFEQVKGYCVNSANPVGHLVLYLCECFNEPNAQLSDFICTGLQLANFWQDVSRDLDIGRVYLPLEDLHRFGYSEADLNARRFTPEFGRLMKFEVDRARQLFVEGLPLVSRVPEDVRMDIELFAQGGLAILKKIEAIGYNVWSQRPTLKKWEKAALLGRVFWSRWRNKIW